VEAVADILGDDETPTGGSPEVDGVDEPVTGEAETVDEEPADDSPTRFEKVRRSSAGVIMTGIALGLQDALQLPKKEPAFVIKATGEPDGDPGPIDLQFDPDDPSNTVAVIRPWLADGPEKEAPPN
jgi:hypothetical protein